ncbi:MAG: hypothetical protein Q8P17_04630, partial [bacterium]|nr:hypothetical protein [bacterium]
SNSCATPISGATGATYPAGTQNEPTTVNYSYKAMDANNAPSGCAGATATWNNLAPNTPTLVSPPNNVWINSREFCAGVSDPGGGNVTAKFVIGGTTYTGLTVPSNSNSCYTHTSDLNGINWYAYATDNNSTNSGNTGTQTAYIDTTIPSAPTVSCGSFTSGQWGNYASPTCTWSDTTGLSPGVFYSCTSQSCSPGGTSNTSRSFTTNFPEGTSYFSAKNCDTGGCSGVTQFVVMRDVTNPTISITNPDAGSPHGSGTFNVVVSNTDALSGIKSDSCTYKVESKNGTTWETTVTAGYACANTSIQISVGATTGNCKYQGVDACKVTISGQDNALNSSTDSPFFSIDWSVPSTSVTGPTGWQTANFIATIDDADGTNLFQSCYARAYNTGTTPPPPTYDGTRGCPDGGFTVDLTSACSVEGTDKCTVQAYAVDAAQNTGAVASRTFSIDKTAPTTDGPKGTQNWQSTDATETTLTCNDTGGSACNTAKDPLYCTGASTCTPGTDYDSANKPSITCATGAECQTTYLQYQSTDNAGNVESTIKSVLFRIDKKAPTPPGAPSVPATSKTGTFTVSWTASSDGTGSGLAGYQLERSANGGTSWTPVGALTANTSVSENNLAEGIYIYHVKSKDIVDNWSIFSGNSSAILVDGTNPVVTVDTFPTIYSANVGAVTLSGSCSENTRDVSLNITSTGGGTAINRSTTCNTASTPRWSITNIDLGGLGNGTLTATASQTDTADNTGTGTKPATKDTVVPTATIQGPASVKSDGLSPEWYIGTFNVSIKDDVHPDPTTCEAKVYNNETPPPSTSWSSRACSDSTTNSLVEIKNTNCTAEGENACKIEVRAKDAAGNVSVLNSRTFSVDRQIPTVPTPTDEGVYKTSTVLTFTATPSDSGSGIQYCNARIDTGTSPDWKNPDGSLLPLRSFTSGPGGYSYAFTGTNGETYSFQYYCVDNAGNDSGWSLPSDGILIDTEGPSTSFISPTPPEGSWQNINFTVTFQDTDLGGSGLTGCDFTIQSYISGSWQPMRTGARACGNTSPINVTVGNTGDCRAPGGNACKVQGSAGDNAGNPRSAASRSFSIGGGEFLIID